MTAAGSACMQSRGTHRQCLSERGHFLRRTRRRLAQGVLGRLIWGDHATLGREEPGLLQRGRDGRMLHGQQQEPVPVTFPAEDEATFDGSSAGKATPWGFPWRDGKRGAWGHGGHARVRAGASWAPVWAPADPRGGHRIDGCSVHVGTGRDGERRGRDGATRSVCEACGRSCEW